MDKNAMTLVEMLIAVSIFAFIIASAYLLFRGFNKVFRRGEIESSYRQDVRIISDIFSRDISSMTIDASGNKEAFSFLASIKDGRIGSLCEIHYKLDNGKFLRAVEVNSDRDLSTCNAEFEELLSGVEDIEFSYRHDIWKASTSGLPSAVKLMLKWKCCGRAYQKEFLAKVMTS